MHQSTNSSLPQPSVDSPTKISSQIRVLWRLMGTAVLSLRIRRNSYVRAISQTSDIAIQRLHFPTRQQ